MTTYVLAVIKLQYHFPGQKINFFNDTILATGTGFFATAGQRLSQITVFFILVI